MKKFVQTALVAAVASSMLTAPASAQGYVNDDEAVRLVASLSGSNVVDGGVAEGSGSFSAVIDLDNRRLCYELSTAGIEAATYAHIHYGASGETGRPLISLRINDDRCTSLAEGTVQDLIADPSQFYVDVVTGENQVDAVRGQLAVASTDSSAGGGD
jgi:CHRD domain